MVTINELTYAYPQNTRGIGPFTFSVRPGEMLHVTGSSGCGKSTLARCISGIIPHIYRGEMRGHVLIDGCRTSDTPLWKLAELAGFVFQNPGMQMLGSSVEEEIIIGLENLGLAHDEIRERLEGSLERFGLTGFRRRQPQTLSGGEQQKLALAAITARRPPILVLDEPLSMLDVTAASELTDYLSELACSGSTIVIFEHRADYLTGKAGLRVMPLDRVNTSGSIPPSVLRLSGVYAAGGIGTLEVDRLSVNVCGKEILNNVNVSIEPGTVTAVVGRNGTGKTTLLRALAGLQRYDGSVTVDGGTPDLGQVYQNADLQLFNASVRSEILYRLSDPDMALYEWLLDTLGLRRYENTPPLILSEGEKKRVALASVIIRKPAHGILLDEPSLGQDTAHKAMLMNICRGLASQGKIVIFTTHDLHLAAMADRIVLLGSEGITADGPPDKVFCDNRAWERAGMFVPHWIACYDRDGITA
jgi:energy-coupling factor transport system ATP-binding protein